MSDQPAAGQPVLLGETATQKALSDPAFFTAMPEFMPFRAKMEQMKADLTRPGGCSSCRRRRVVRSLFGEFMATTLSLSPDGIARLKGYFGVPNFLVNHMDTTTGKVQVRLI